MQLRLLMEDIGNHRTLSLMQMLVMMLIDTDFYLIQKEMLKTF